MSAWRRVASATSAGLDACFGRHKLLVVNTVSCGAFLGLGDVIQQRIERRRGLATRHDWARTGRLFLVGLSQGPPHHYFYIWLDKAVPGRGRGAVGGKVLLDQLLGAPFFAASFFLAAGLLEGRPLPACWREFCAKFPAVYAFDWLLWPPAQALNFSLVPPAYRVLYVNAVTVVWDVFLSYIKHCDQPSITKEE